MPSPFPGMNPFLEQDDAWHDFRKRLIPGVADRLVEQVATDYIVKIAEHVPGREEAPARVQSPAVDIERLAFVEVRDRRSRELVTVVELLGPSNKNPGPDREQYLAKRSTILGGSVHFVEIDLLRVGRPLPPAERPPSDYAVMVSRVERRPVADLWPIGLRDRLPVVPIPLRAADPEARIDLQEILHRIYDAAGYAYYIYTSRPDPELPPADREWAESLIAGPR